MASNQCNRYVESQELIDQMNSLKIKFPNVEGNELAAVNTTQANTVTIGNIDAGDADEDAGAKFNHVDISYLHKVIRTGLIKNNRKLKIQRHGPSSPLFSIKSFEALCIKPNLLKGIYEMGFKAPSKIQETALTALLAYPPQNLIAQSQSGTGKTAAFVLAMLSRIDTDKHYPQVLCLSPTYELAIQTGEVVAHMAKFCPDIEFKYVVSGEKFPRDKKLTEHILIGTPGKVLDWGLKYRSFDLSKISVFVLDEADFMLSTQGHQDYCIRIHRSLSPSCQMMFFSATYANEIMEFAELIVQNPLIVKLKREEESLDNIDQCYVKCLNQDQKYEAVTNIYGTVGVGQAVIFCETCRAASWLADKMSQDGHAVAVLTGELSFEERISVLDRFRKGDEKVLIITNVLARGIDVRQITIVVNYDLPVHHLNGKANCETYLHRIGRTGRFGSRGLAINLVDSAESMEICRDIEKHFNRKIKYLNSKNIHEIANIANYYNILKY